jgi:hypothetical protein
MAPAKVSDEAYFLGEMLVCKIEQTGCGFKITFRSQAGGSMEITNKLVCWLLDRYFERAMILLQRHSAPVPLNTSQQEQGKKVQ